MAHPVLVLHQGQVGHLVPDPKVLKAPQEQVVLRGLVELEVLLERAAHLVQERLVVRLDLVARLALVAHQVLQVRQGILVTQDLLELRVSEVYLEILASLGV